MADDAHCNDWISSADCGKYPRFQSAVAPYKPPTPERLNAYFRELLDIPDGADFHAWVTPDEFRLIKRWLCDGIKTGA